MRKRWAAAAAVAFVIATLMIRWQHDDGVGCEADAKIADLEFTLKDVNGKDVSLAERRGKVLLLDFWATWCGPCKVEIPAFVRLYEKYRTQGFEIVGIVVQDDFAAAGPFSEKYKMNYPVVDGTQRDDLVTAFGPFVGLPTSILIDREGRVCSRHLGIPEVDMSRNPLDEAVEEAFDAEIRALL